MKYANFEIYHTSNAGVSGARNFGMDRATGEYITFLDADDAYEENAVETMQRYAEKGEDIVQFGQIRHMNTGEVLRRAWPEGEYDLWHLRRYWQMVWNKIYKTATVKKYGIRYADGLQFGEDEIFNAQILLRVGKIYHAPEMTVHHYMDDMNSLCRGHLSLEKLQIMDTTEKMLAKQEREKGNEDGANWLDKVRTRHHHSKTFQAYGWKRYLTGKYDIVYFVKDEPENEELRYSLRSVEKNMPHRNVWFYGGKPDGIEPDNYAKVMQTEPSKFENVRSMLIKACQNDEITEDFWLFNDDFFIMQPFDENSEPTYNRELREYIAILEAKYGQITEWTKLLRHLADTLEAAGKDTLNYAVHKPILINRKKALEVLQKFPDEPMFRALYGNYWNIGGINEHDRKVKVIDYPVEKFAHWKTISTEDASFTYGPVGKFIRDSFLEKSRFEK
jgi:glycosyltransferase involved in cell wall biosynthesis